MKNYAIALFGAIMLVLAVFAPTLVDKVSSKNTSMAETPTGQETAQSPKAPSQAAEAQYATTKSDSFSAGNALVAGKNGLHTVDAMVKRGKTYLLTQVNNRLKQYESFKSKLESATVLKDSEKKGLISELNAQMDIFEAFKAEIDKSTSKQDVKNVADKIKAEWIKSRLTVARAQGQLLAAKENQLISDADTYSLGMQKRIESLKASGKGTKEREKLLSAYSKKIAAAKQHMESAKAKSSAVTSASTDAEKEKLMREKKVLLKNAHDNLREAYKLLKEGAKNLRS